MSGDALLSAASPRILLPWLEFLRGVCTAPRCRRSVAAVTTTGAEEGSSRVEDYTAHARAPAAPAPSMAKPPPHAWPGVRPIDGLPAEPLYAHTAASFAEAVEARIRRGGVLARVLYREFFACNGDLQAACKRIPELMTAPALAAALVSLCGVDIPLRFSEMPARAPATGQTEKYVLKTQRRAVNPRKLRVAGNISDSPGSTAPLTWRAGSAKTSVNVAEAVLELEMVIMPAPGKSRVKLMGSTNDGESREVAASEPSEVMEMSARNDAWSLCVSSQVGCRYGCAFCETGRLGLLRSLLAEEIVAQVALAVHVLGLRVANVVFMGMGEPLDNLDAVIQAVCNSCIGSLIALVFRNGSPTQARLCASSQSACTTPLHLECAIVTSGVHPPLLLSTDQGDD